MSIFRQAIRAVAVGGLLLAAATFGVKSPASAQDTNPCPTVNQIQQVQTDFLNILNTARTQAGLGALTYNPLLTTAATQYSQVMVDQQFFDHTGKDGSQPWDRAQRAGYTDPFIGENIAINATASGQGVFDQWWNSPGHKANMMNGDFNVTGLGVACGRYQDMDNYIYYTQMLGRQAAAPLSAAAAATLDLNAITSATATASPTATLDPNATVGPTATLDPQLDPPGLAPTAVVTSAVQ